MGIINLHGTYIKRDTQKRVNIFQVINKNIKTKVKDNLYKNIFGKYPYINCGQQPLFLALLNNCCKQIVNY